MKSLTDLNIDWNWNFIHRVKNRLLFNFHISCWIEMMAHSWMPYRELYSAINLQIWYVRDSYDIPSFSFYRPKTIYYIQISSICDGYSRTNGKWWGREKEWNFDWCVWCRDSHHFGSASIVLFVRHNFSWTVN